MHANSFRHSITFYAKALFLCLAFSATTLKAAENSAGTVTFMLGKAFINGDSPIQVGSKIKAGDVIETLSNGHVHIRFVDNGLVSVRPDSRLFIEQYQFNAEKPTDSVIKFVLEEGIMRSISGTGAKAARDKFRLNTPIAAIGVRGTDFVVKASNNLLQAVVNEGAIVVAPFSAECQASATGPCQSNVVELTGEAKQLLEFSLLQESPRLIPLTETFASDLIDEQRLELKQQNATDVDDSSNSTNANQRSDSDTESSKNNNSDASLGTSSSALASTGSAKTASTDKFESGLQSTISSINKLQSSIADTSSSDISGISGLAINDNLSLVEDSPISDKIAELAQTQAFTGYDVSTAKMAWGRWSQTSTENQARSTDSVIFDKSIASDGRISTVSTMGLTLYREASNLTALDATLQSVDFNLQDAQATLYSSGNSYVMDVESGKLNIDFSNRSFSTQLTLDHELTSTVAITAQGTINQQGYMFSNSGNSVILGASTLEGDASSYIFYKEVDAGIIEGATYWSSLQSTK